MVTDLADFGILLHESYEYLWHSACLVNEKNTCIDTDCNRDLWLYSHFV
jgi:hypothetical protein